MDPNWLSTLLSIAGVNRRVGSGDVVRYQAQTDSPNARDTQAATPGVSSPGTAFDPNSALANLSALTPAYNAALAASQAAGIPSGTATATAQPFPSAAPGPGSNDVATQAQIGAAPVAGTPGVGLALPTAPATSAPAPVMVPVVSPGGGDAGVAGDAGGGPAGPGGTGGLGEGGTGVGGIGGTAAGGEGGPGTSGEGGTGGEGGDGTGGVFKRGGFVTQGRPNSKTDDVSAKLQHGEFVIPREAVLHLAATAPAVLQHVMHVSAMHALANKAKTAPPSPGAMLTGQNGGLPPQSAQPQGYRNGGLVVPAGVGPQLHPAVANAIRQAIALHAAAPRPAVMQTPRPQMAQMGPAVASQGRPPVLPPLAPRETNV